MDRQPQVLTILEVSKKVNIPRHTLRFWEKELGVILNPLRTQGGQRRYTIENISLIQEIKKLRKRGMSLAEIKGKVNNSKRIENNRSSRIDLLANRVAEAVKVEVYNFLKMEKDV